MFSTLKRTALTGVVSVVVGASLLLAPAAQAAPHGTGIAAQVSIGAKDDSFTFKVGDHRDRLVLDPVGTASKRVKLDGKSTVLAARYRVTLKHGKRVLLAERTSTYPALLASLNVAVGRNTSDTTVRAVVARTVALPAREAEAGIEATAEQLDLESAAVKAATDVLLDVERWRSAHPEATTLDGYAVPAELAHVGEGLGADLTLSGTIERREVRAVINTNGAVYKLDSDGHQRFSDGFFTGQVVRNRIR